MVVVASAHNWNYYVENTKRLSQYFLIDRYKSRDRRNKYNNTFNLGDMSPSLRLHANTDIPYFT